MTLNSRTASYGSRAILNALPAVGVTGTGSRRSNPLLMIACMPVSLRTNSSMKGSAPPGVSRDAVQGPGRSGGSASSSCSWSPESGRRITGSMPTCSSQCGVRVYHHMNLALPSAANTLSFRAFSHSARSSGSSSSNLRTFGSSTGGEMYSFHSRADAIIPQDAMESGLSGSRS